MAFTRRGRGGIRTHGPLVGPTVFKTVAFVRSATLPNRTVAAATGPGKGAACRSGL